MDNHDHEPHAAADSDQRRLLIVLGVASAYLLTELVGGYLTGSLALLSDAVHMLTDISALCLGLLTLWISRRPASSAKSYGYLRAEILGASLNGLFLWVLVVYIWIEAAQRLRHPHPVSGLGVMAVAIVGIGVNTFSAWMTAGDGHAGHKPGIDNRCWCCPASHTGAGRWSDPCTPPRCCRTHRGVAERGWWCRCPARSVRWARSCRTLARHCHCHCRCPRDRYL